MGRKKKFIDKKNSATFQLLARDSAASSSLFPFPFSSSSSSGAEAAASSTSPSDRVFVRVDTNAFSVPGFFDDDDDAAEGRVVNADESRDSAFADAPGDTSDADDDGAASSSRGRGGGALPDHVRREILELGLPDDGYNYLAHLREIRNAGGGSAYYQNPRARFDLVPLDVKDAVEDLAGDSIYSVASRTASVKVQKVADPDVAKLLDDSDLSRFGSDVEDLEEDFVVQANRPEGEEEEEEAEEDEDENIEAGCERGRHPTEGAEHGEAELEDQRKERVRRLLDEQFDMLTLQEYDDDSDNGDAYSDDADRETLSSKIVDTLKKYGVGDQESSTLSELEPSADVIRRCQEYAEGYLNESQEDEEAVLVQESDDESEVWDCETIVSTFSNLDNHPGQIQAPENPKKLLPTLFPGEATAKRDVIALRGKEMLPVDYLHQKKRNVESTKKSKAEVSSGSDKLKTRVRKEESKEEKKERKAAVKEERREARRAKKEMKGLYRGEAQRAQMVASVSGPSAIHLM
ncbi:Protein LTV [Ananas comosus]|uniref:Protein LTV n=1 Tax=Ananas comosus TaxID=4615 RepID=A0A199UD95_ANACO|nr:Protein LTV [Ananas comosus]